MALSTLRFSTFNVANQVFFQSSSRLSFALVNLKPIVPGRESLTLSLFLPEQGHRVGHTLGRALYLA